MRNFLREQGKKHFNLGNSIAITYLNLKDPLTIKLMRKVMIDYGYKIQRWGHKVLKKLKLTNFSKIAPASTIIIFSSGKISRIDCIRSTDNKIVSLSDFIV